MPTKSDYTFFTAWEQYVKSLANTNMTIENKISIANHFLPVFKDKNIAEITQSDIKSY
jgi:hypothetical protein